MRDIYHNLGISEVISPAIYSADATSPAVELFGFESAMLAIHVGVGGVTFNGRNKIEFKLTHSDDNSEYTPVKRHHVRGAPEVDDEGLVLALKAAHSTSSVSRIGYIGHKRYIKLELDFSGTHGTGTPIAATVIKGHAHKRPVL